MGRCVAICVPFEFLYNVAGNVVCFVPNGAKAVNLWKGGLSAGRAICCNKCKSLDNEMILDVNPVLRWRGHKNFVKARHVQPAPAGTTLESAPCLGREIRTPRWDAGKQPVVCVLV